jgi:acetyl esterase/lipase
MQSSTNKIQIHNNVPYVANSTDIKLSYDLYLPAETSKETTPLLIYIHGGSWRTGDKSDFAAVGTNISSNFNIATMIVNYHLSTGTEYHHPSHIEESTLALIHAYSNPNNFAYDSSKIYLAGHSCGAQIVGLMALSPQNIKAFQDIGLNSDIYKKVYSSLKGIISIQGLYDMVALNKQYPSYNEWIVQALTTDEENWKLASPIYQPISTEQKPKFYIVQSPKDTLLDFEQTELFISYLKKSNINYELDETIQFDHFEVPTSVEFANYINNLVFNK